ncbi:phiSA1p31-related protein [Embleya sp. NPDC001921]
MKEPRCALCGKGVFSGAILTTVVDTAGARSLACRAWCGPTPAPVMSVERLEQVRRAASTDLERELLAEIDLAFRLVRRAEMDKYEAAGRTPDWVRETTQVLIELRGGRVLSASGQDWQEWWANGTVDTAFETEIDEPCHLTSGAPSGMFDLSGVYADRDGCRWAHQGDWQYDEPLLWRVNEHGEAVGEEPEFLGDVLSEHGPLTRLPQDPPVAEAPA